MAKQNNDALSLLSDPSIGLSSEEDNTSTSDIIGASARDSIGLFKYPVRNVPIANIIENSDAQFRQNPFDPDHDIDDASLLATMGNPNSGLLQPIMVQEIAGVGVNTGPFGQGKKYRMVFGHRRLASARILGWEKIQAHVAKPEEDVSAFTLTENSGVKPQTPYEKAVAIRRFIEKHPLAPQTEIVRITGWNKTYVSRLVQITENDTPKSLLNLLARGTAINVVLSLKPVFIASPLSNHTRLVELLDGCSEDQAKRLADAVVEQKMDPFVAIEMYGISPKKAGIKDAVSSEPVQEEQFPSPVMPTAPESINPVVGDRPAIKPGSLLGINPVPRAQPQNDKPVSRLPSGIVADNSLVVEKFAIENGTSKALVRALIAKAKAQDLSREEFEDACLISAKCGDAAKAIDYLLAIMADKRAYTGFQHYAKGVRLSLKTMAVRKKDHLFVTATALCESVVTPLPLDPEKPGKRA